jgi:hypothetical protein
MSKKVHLLYCLDEGEKKLISIFTTNKKAEYYASQFNKVRKEKFSVHSMYLNRLDNFFNYEILPFELYNPKKR